MADNKIEQYLIDMRLSYQQVNEKLWLLDDEERTLQGIAIMLTEPLVTIRAEIFNVPQNNLLELYTKLLEINANDVIHGAFALDSDSNKIILINTLNYNSMDYEDFRTALEAFSLALTEHYPILSKYREKA
ncbi:MAG: YbjN domain-containing protein [Treponema sp.]|nr:YbjN domain-containing protein [Treponema sp.]MCL2252666.1 YbjN domain-containing protein [Treponema sp.]